MISNTSPHFLPIRLRFFCICQFLSFILGLALHVLIVLSTTIYNNPLIQWIRQFSPTYFGMVLHELLCRSLSYVFIYDIVVDKIKGKILFALKIILWLTCLKRDLIENEINLLIIISPYLSYNFHKKLVKVKISQPTVCSCLSSNIFFVFSLTRTFSIMWNDVTQQIESVSDRVE